MNGLAPFSLWNEWVMAASGPLRAENNSATSLTHLLCCSACPLREKKTKEPITSCRGGGPQPQHRSKNELKKSKLK